MSIKNQIKPINNQMIKELKLLKNLERHRIKGNIVKIENWGDIWINFINQTNNSSGSKPLLIYDHNLKLIDEFANKEVARFNNKDYRWKFTSNKIKIWFENEHFSLEKHSFHNWLTNWYNLYTMRSEQNRSQLQTLFLVSNANRFKILTYLRNKPKKNVLNKLFFYIYTCNIINTKLNLLYNFIFKQYTRFFNKYAKKNNLSLLLITLRVYNTSKLINLKPWNFFRTLKKLIYLKNNLYSKMNINSTLNIKTEKNLEFIPYYYPGLIFNSNESNIIILNMNKWLEKIFYYRLFFTLQSNFFHKLCTNYLNISDQENSSEKSNQVLILKTLLQLTKRWQNISWLMKILKKKYKYFYLKTKLIN